MSAGRTGSVKKLPKTIYVIRDPNDSHGGLLAVEGLSVFDEPAIVGVYALMSVEHLVISRKLDKKS